MKILIFGATGETGLEVVRKALDAGYQVNVLVRSPDKLPDDIKQKIEVFHGELINESLMLNSMENVNVVISALGPVFGQNSAGSPLTKGYRLIIQCMEKKGIRRLIALSTPSLTDENDRFSLLMKLGVLFARFFDNNGYNDIISSGQFIREQTNLHWTIYRVGALQNSNQESGTLKAGYVGEAGLYLYRKDIAKFCIDEISENKWIHKTPMLWSDGTAKD